MGIRRGNFVSATPTIHRRIRRRHLLCRRRHYERLGSLHVERESMGKTFPITYSFLDESVLTIVRIGD